MKITLVIPTYNEAQNIPILIDKNFLFSRESIGNAILYVN